MSNDPMNWVDAKEQEKGESKDSSSFYFDIKEGKQEFVLLSHCAPLAQIWDNVNKKYRIAEEGDTGVSIKGVCWVLQDGVIKSAKLPYVVVKDIRSYQQNPEWEFSIPFLHTFTLTAKNAKTKEVEYTLNASPKKVELSEEIKAELAKKPTPEEIVEKIKEGKPKTSSVDYPKDEPDPAGIPF